MPPAVIARVNLLGKAEPSILTFTDRHGREIGDYVKDTELVEEDDALATEDVIEDEAFIEDVIPAVGITGVDNTPGDGTAGQAAKPTGVEVEDAPQAATFENGLGQVPQVRETTPDAIEIADPATDAIEIADPLLNAIEIAPPRQGMAE